MARTLNAEFGFGADRFDKVAEGINALIEEAQDGRGSPYQTVQDAKEICKFPIEGYLWCDWR